MKIADLYYQKFLSLFIDHYRNDLINDHAGHCMKITGLTLDKLKQLYPLICQIDSPVKTYILSDTESGEEYISATKLIEYRNDLSISLLVLIPVNSRTSAEDSYGDATFMELSIAPIEKKLYDQLIDSIPSIHSYIVHDILNYIKEHISLIDKINYLLYLTLNDWTPQALGDGLYLLGLIPDSALEENKNVLRKRLACNVESSLILGDFSLSVSERVNKLPIQKGSNQKNIAAFLKQEEEAKNRMELTALLNDKYPQLNFRFWEIPEIEDTKELVLRADLIPIAGKELVRNPEGDGYTLSIPTGKKVKLRIRVITQPIPKDNKDLKFFRINLMSVDGMYLVGEVKKVKVTEGVKAYRDVTFEIHDNQFDDGSYYFHVLAEDEHGTVLNNDDPFRHDSVQEEWDRRKQEDETLSKEQFQEQNRVLLTSDTETFHLQATDEEVEVTETRKAKIDNVLQAYFHYRIEKVRRKEELDIPAAQQAEWLDGHQVAQIFHIKYNPTHNYQIALSKKLTAIETCLLNHSDEIGMIKAQIGGNPSQTELQSLRFNPLAEVLEIPQELLEKREELFSLIKASAPNETGVTATFDIYNHIDIVKEYITTYHEWLSSITNTEDAISLNAELQLLDSVNLSVEMPDGTHTNLKLLPPMHPLRLAWLVNLFDLYTDWESKTAQYPEQYKSSWFKKLDKLFYGELIPETAPLILADRTVTNYYQYVGELTFGWALYVNPAKTKDDAFASSFRQIKSYLASLLNIASEKRIDSDINQELIYRHIRNYIRQHPYAGKLVINMFNAGDAAVFARTMIDLEREGYNLQYEVRLFADDKMILPGEAFRELLNPETQISEEAEAFSQAAGNRLFPKLRFSINELSDFINKPYDYQAHISFLVNPFPAKTVLIRQDEKLQSFYLNGVVNRSIIQVVEKEKGYTWNRYFSENKMPVPLNEFSNKIVALFVQYQRFIAQTLAVSSERSVPSTRLELTENDIVLLSLIHDVSDWVVTFDKNMGPEFYDLPCIQEGEIPYLLDYIPSDDVTGISSYLTTRPTSEIEGLMLPHFRAFGIDVEDKNKFKTLLEDVRSVSSSLLLQANNSHNTAFEVLGTTFMKRMLQKKGLLEDAFLIPVDLHKNLFENLDTDTKERADTLLVNIHPQKREIVFTVVEIKCRTTLSAQEKEDLQDKMNQQIENTIHALQVHFDMEYQSFDRLDRELKTMDLSSLLTFYLQRAERYNQLNPDGYEMYMDFLTDLCNGFNLKFKNLGIIFDFSSIIPQQKEYMGDTTFYTMGRSVIEDILDNDSLLKTIAPASLEEKDLISFFEVPERTKTARDIPTAVILANSENTVLEDKESAAPETQCTGDNNKTIKEPEATYTIIQSELDTQKETKLQDEKQEQIQPEEKSEVPGVPTQPMSVNDIAYNEPPYEITIGKTSNSIQYGILGKTFTNNRPIAIDLSETNTISLFGVQGGGKSYTIGIISEMVLKQFSDVNKLPAPLAGVIFHYSESKYYAPEFTSMIYSNDNEAQLKKLKEEYGAEPGKLEDVILLAPKDKVEERKLQYPSIEIHPIQFNSNELNVEDWMFLLGAVGNDSTYIKQLRAIMKTVRKNISLRTIRRGVVASQLLNNTQKNLAEQRLQFAEEYIDDNAHLSDLLKPGRLIIVDLRDEFIAEDEALGLFVVMLNIFSGIEKYNEKSFNKFIVFDEAHKYMNNKDLTNSIVKAIREMRHKGVSLMIASQDPMSLPTEIIELSSIVLLHKFNSPQWVKHVQRSIIQLGTLTPAEMSSLVPGEAFLWATKSTDKTIMVRPIKISTRPRVTKHGGDTIKAVE